MTTKPQKINDIFQEARKRFIKWVNGKPTGEFTHRIKVNQGGIRGKQKFRFDEDDEM